MRTAGAVAMAVAVPRSLKGRTTGRVFNPFITLPMLLGGKLRGICAAYYFSVTRVNF